MCNEQLHLDCGGGSGGLHDGTAQRTQRAHDSLQSVLSDLGQGRKCVKGPGDLFIKSLQFPISLKLFIITIIL